jgi:hypothetical protein
MTRCESFGCGAEDEGVGSDSKVQGLKRDPKVCLQVFGLRYRIGSGSVDKAKGVEWVPQYAHFLWLVRSMLRNVCLLEDQGVQQDPEINILIFFSP